MTCLLAPFVDPELLTTPQPWLDMVYGILDELTLQGHLQASARKGEMQQLQQIFRQSPNIVVQISSDLEYQGSGGNAEQQRNSGFGNPDEDATLGTPNFPYNLFDDAIWPTTFTADQLMTVADGLDLDGIEEVTTGSFS